ncbi:Uncharacterised protein [uncultured Faecalibacterium sp.]|nr:Uncharacterised protein [uncultured Faecalibacterium sp.]
MTVDARKERNHYFDLLKYLLFIFVVLIHNPLPENLWGGMDSDCSLYSSYLFCYFRLFQQGSRKKAA